MITLSERLRARAERLSVCGGRGVSSRLCANSTKAERNFSLRSFSRLISESAVSPGWTSRGESHWVVVVSIHACFRRRSQFPSRSRISSSPRWSSSLSLAEGRCQGKDVASRDHYISTQGTGPPVCVPALSAREESSDVLIFHFSPRGQKHPENRC